MRLLPVGVVLLALTSFVSGVPQDPAPASRPTKTRIEQLAWIAGSWQATAQNGGSTEEHWTRPAGKMMLGINRSVMGDGGSFEYLRIEQRGAAVYYYASPGGARPTRFEMTELGASRVVFENPKHDFPQRIIYWLDEGNLHARAEATEDGSRGA